ncbi:MAG: hypothetical protein HON94_09805 [Methylococcales bacterium]|jgi:hypothetical protein|nr:hypothetical protein [Methylococcales bacterium]MBT7409096.1 hypothetical protein [Methylococcales bacterium]
MNTFRVVLSLFVFHIAGNVNAGCSRSDVDYYLSKGFSNDQVMSLCRDDSKLSEKTVSSLGKRGVKEKKVNNSNAQHFLEIAIKANSVDITSEAISFTRKHCIVYGEEDIYGFQPQVCLNVKTMLKRNGLMVLSKQARSLFSSDQQIQVGGGIAIELLTPLPKLSVGDKRDVMNELNVGDKLWISIRSEIDLDRVVQQITSLSK